MRYILQQRTLAEFPTQRVKIQTDGQRPVPAGIMMRTRHKQADIHLYKSEMKLIENQSAYLGLPRISKHLAAGIGAAGCLQVM